jgi:RNA polymerase sigma-70 factor (ECF subfamily)
MRALAQVLRVEMAMQKLQSTRSSEATGKCNVAHSFEEHHEYLLRNALGRLRNREQAEDAVQDSFLAALGAARRFSGSSSQRTWLTGILKHKVCDHVRRACRDRAMFQYDQLTDQDEFGSRFTVGYVSRSVDPSLELERKELRDAIQNALAKLPRRLAQVFSLYESEDWTEREICDALGISENNLWIILHRARKQLREHMLPWRSVT